jgi:ketosteroid isomerase-like protein
VTCPPFHILAASLSVKAELLKLLDRFADAWSRHDLDALMSMMTDDCVFGASAGPQVEGQRSEGSRRCAPLTPHCSRYFLTRIGRTPGISSWAIGVSKWTFTGTQKDGKRVEINGCDLFTFHDGKSPSRTRPGRID